MVNVMAKNWAEANSTKELLPIDVTGKIRTDADNKACLSMATTVKYVENLEKELKANPKYPRKAGETCDACSLYDTQKEGKPKCTLFAKCFVHAKGSCMTWTKKTS